jgi:hypothetical protein
LEAIVRRRGPGRRRDHEDQFEDLVLVELRGQVVEVPWPDIARIAGEEVREAQDGDLDR